MAEVRIDRVSLRQVDLPPKVRRTDAIQSFVTQETLLLTLHCSDGIEHASCGAPQGMRREPDRDIAALHQPNGKTATDCQRDRDRRQIPNAFDRLVQKPACKAIEQGHQCEQHQPRQTQNGQAARCRQAEALKPDQQAALKKYQNDQIRKGGGLPALKLTMQEAGVGLSADQETQIQGFYDEEAQQRRELKQKLFGD